MIETRAEILLVDKKFVIEAEIDEPTSFSGFVTTGRDYRSSFRAVVEPQLQYLYFLRTVMVPQTSCWQQRSQVCTLTSYKVGNSQRSICPTLEEYSNAYAQYLAEWEAANSEQEESPDDGKTESSDEEVAEVAEDQETEEDAGTLASASTEDSDDSIVSEESGLPPADGCEHVAQEAQQSTRQVAASDYEMPEYYKLYEELQSIRSSALQEVAQNFDNPLQSLIAMELGAFGFRDENRSDAFPIYDKLAELLDDDTVARRVTPARERLVWYLESEENDSGLSPGQKAPEFTLANLEGTDVALYDVLAEKEVVLIDFLGIMVWSVHRRFSRAKETLCSLRRPRF